MNKFFSPILYFLSVLVFILLTSAFAQETGATQSLELELTFIESAPKDSFVIRNAGTCALVEAELNIDLSESEGKLIFDTTESGAGVEVFQPFEITAGELELISSDLVKDGDTQLRLRLLNLAVGAQASFTIDLDDVLADGELGMIRVSDSEMKGTRFTVSLEEDYDVFFTDGNTVVLSELPCL